MPKPKLLSDEEITIVIEECRANQPVLVSATDEGATVALGRLYGAIDRLSYTARVALRALTELLWTGGLSLCECCPLDNSTCGLSVDDQEGECIRRILRWAEKEIEKGD